VLAVGIDYRGQDYLYGLADVIRVVRIDFTKPQVNIVPIPRNVLVSPPPRLDVAGDMLLNQAYFFGTEGMGHYSGSGYGAGSLAETIYYSFGIRSDQYVVVDFRAFVQFIDLIGGIEVDLPTYVDNSPDSYFPAGKQTLNGTQALELARIRRKYSDVTRINNQTIVLQGVFNQLKNPAVITKIPQIYKTMIDSVLTDLTPEKISTLLCLLEKVDSSNLNFYEPPVELLTQEAVFIPNMNQDMIIYRWDQEFINWLHRSTWESK
jgi:LCP family protein required for cell wall assembly